MAKKKDFYNQSISGEDIELLAQFTGKLDKVLHNKRVSYLRKKNQKETKEVSFEANASYLESVSCRIEVSVEECVEEKLMLEETDKHLQNLPVREYFRSPRVLLFQPAALPATSVARRQHRFQCLRRYSVPCARSASGRTVPPAACCGHPASGLPCGYTGICVFE